MGLRKLERVKRQIGFMGFFGVKFFKEIKGATNLI